ncbi:MAG: hypothetical protein K2M69_02575 [Muribaculaceae bacterium]|nr:hypothetical protein [Muribaculaceae bacterium]
MDTFFLSRHGESEELRFYHSKEGDDAAPEFLFWIKSEADQVFFRPKNNPDTTWYLMYDFSLIPGESKYIYHYLGDTIKPRRSYVKCVDIENSPENPAIVLMRMKIGRDETLQYTDKGFWIKGMGSECGVERNDWFSWDGGNKQIWEIYNNGNHILSTDALPQKYLLPESPNENSCKCGCSENSD